MTQLGRESVSSPTEYIAEDGTLITRAMIDRWIHEIDNGFPNSVLEPMDTREQKRRFPMETHSVRLPGQLWALAKHQAEREGKTISEYMRDALTEKLPLDAA